MTLKTLALAGLMAISATMAQAATFDFSFTLTTGNIVQGALDGTVSATDPNLVGNAYVTRFSVTSSTGTLLAGPAVPDFYSGSFLNFTHHGFNPTGTVSFDGSKMDLVACNLNCVLGFAVIRNMAGSGNAYYHGSDEAFGSLAFLPATWSLTEVPAVPLPATAPLVLAGIGALFALRRKRA